MHDLPTTTSRKFAYIYTHDLPKTTSRRFAYADDLAIMHSVPKWQTLSRGHSKSRHGNLIHILTEVETKA